MPRRKPISTRQKKEAIKLKRAIKRGEIQKDDVKPRDRHREKRPVDPSRKLQSAFVQLPKEFLDKSRQLCSSLALQRPIQNNVAVFDTSLCDNHADFICPQRPKWHYDFSKLQVERNEEGLFRKWLEKSDAIVTEWRASGPNTGDSETMPRSTCYFERNIEVWRQLWRVTEISQIVLVLLDSRCPLLHYPPSLANYLSANNRKHILVLTKVDMVGPSRADAWTQYFRKTHPGTPIVQVESYIEKDSTADQGNARYEPYIPETFRAKLIGALKGVHEELLTPPEKILDNPNALARWKPPVRRVIDWVAVAEARGGKVGSIVGGALVPQQTGQDDEESEPQFLTVGLIGQPNVGKSSLLNALFGARMVHASKAPGLTKHLQTHFWTQDVRLVDCPGLVVPNLAPMELQVLSGILPISRIAAVPACVYFVSQYMPLEQIFKLTHPMQGTGAPIEDKRTWRDGVSRLGTKSQVLDWTAMDIMVAYANFKGWQTAKAGRPDIHRAGNAMLRTLAEGRIFWAFWPPDTDITANQEVTDTAGIWIPASGDADEWDEELEDDTDTEYDTYDGSESHDSDEMLGEYKGEESDEKEKSASSSGHGRFALLFVEDDPE